MGSMNGGCRVRCTSSMAGWSMVSDKDAVGYGITPTKSPEGVNYPESTASGFENTQELVSLFRRLLESFLAEFFSAESFRPLPPMIGDGRPVDLFNLYLNVSHRGGFDAVSENSSWVEVAQESGLGFSNSASVKLIYVKYLDALARLLNRVIAGEADGASLDLSGISDDLVGRLKDFLSEVKRKYELSKGEASMELGAELKWFISKAKRRHDAVREIQRLEMIDKRLENKGSSSPGKRKRECPLETLRWLTEVAKDPLNSYIGHVPDRSKWESYGSEEPWKQLILFKDSRTITDSACEKTWQKLQKLHPSMYDDSDGPGYSLRARLGSNGNQVNEKEDRKGKASSEKASQSLYKEDRACPRVGSKFQAEVPEWTGITSESDSKWVATQVWPLSKEQKNKTLLFERDPIGKGRQDSCGCQNPGSIECVRFHISTKQEKLKIELGTAYYMWRFHTMGEGTLQSWTDLELMKVKCMMAFPPTLSPSLFDRLKMILSSKSRREIVSYFYNVTLLQFRANQSRITPYEVDSDTDPAPVMLSPKKKRRR